MLTSNCRKVLERIDSVRTLKLYENLFLDALFLRSFTYARNKSLEKHQATIS